MPRMPKPQPKLKPRPKQSRPEIVVTPKPGSNIVEQAPFIGFMLDELIQEQKASMKPFVDLMQKVLKELQDRRDEGEYRYYEATASTTVTNYDFIRDFGFPIKGLMISNDGNADIQIGYMSYKHLLDVPDEKLITIRTTDGPYRDRNNTKTIRRILVQTAAGTSDYRLWVYW